VLAELKYLSTHAGDSKGAIMSADRNVARMIDAEASTEAGNDPIADLASRVVAKMMVLQEREKSLQPVFEMITGGEIPWI
jgi:hypothetical protein